MIRPYNSSDKPAVLELLALNTPQFFAAEEKQDLISYLNSEVEAYFVYEKKNEIIGCGGLNFIGTNEARISWDIVHPNHHGEGVGRSLVNHRLIEARKKQNIQKIVVRTSQHAFRFYQKMGFSLIKLVNDFWAPGFDLYYMEIKVEPKIS